MNPGNSKQNLVDRPHSHPSTSSATGPFCICCHPDGVVPEEDKDLELIIACDCTPESNLGTFHYDCLVHYIIAQRDRKCPHCDKTFEDRRIKRYIKSKTFLRFIRRFIFGPYPIAGDIMGLIWALLVFSIFLLIGGLFLDIHDIFRYLIMLLSGIFFILFGGMVIMTYGMWESEPEVLIRFRGCEVSEEAPNGVRYLDMTQAQDRHRQQDIRRQIEEGRELDEIEAQDLRDLQEQERIEREQAQREQAQRAPPLRNQEVILNIEDLDYIDQD